MSESSRGKIYSRDPRNPILSTHCVSHAAKNAKFIISFHGYSNLNSVHHYFYLIGKKTYLTQRG